MHYILQAPRASIVSANKEGLISLTGTEVTAPDAKCR